MKNIDIDNLFEVLKNLKYFFLFFFISTSFFAVSYFTSNYQLIAGNQGLIFLYFLLLFQILIALLFGLFVTLTVFKFNYFSGLSLKQSLGSGTGGLFGLLAAGCASCSITIASLLGLGAFISLLPFYGMELSVIAVGLLIVSNYLILRDLKVCKVKIKKK